MDVTTYGMRASTKEQTKREKSGMQTESKTQEKQQCLSQRSNRHCLSQRPEGHCLTQRREHCLSQRREHCLSQRQNNIATRRGGKENKEKLFFPHRGTRDTFELIRICWTLKTKSKEQGCFPIDSQLMGHFPPKRQALPRVSRLHSGSL